MKFSVKTISILTYAMLALVSAAFFLVPAKQEAQAQSGQARSFCFNPSTKAFILPSSSGSCPSGSNIVQAPRGAKGFCVFRDNGVYVAEPTDANPSLNSSGTRCLDDSGDEYADFKSISSITQTYNPGGTPTTNTPTTNTPSTNNSTTKPPVNGGGNTSTQNQGGCDAGFRKLGPLCVPGSPVGSSDSILGEQTAGGLAARIVRILLYFAGIVAVIMAIIGGYYVMTAAGNETQAANGRKTLTNAIIGLVIVILSYIIIQAVISFVT